MPEESMKRRLLWGLVVSAALVVPALSSVSAGGTAISAQSLSCVVHGAPSPVAPIAGVGNGAPGPWPSKVLVKQAVVQVLDPATRTAYGLVSESRDSEGPDRLRLPAPRPGDAAGSPSLVSAGPRGTVWVGYGKTLVHVEISDGALLATETVPSGTIVSLDTDPALRERTDLGTPRYRESCT